ncbi:MAG: endonuclease V [Thermoanaerobaculia bacterium]
MTDWRAWPETAEELIATQEALARERPEPWRPPADLASLAVGACFICFERGTSGPGWAGERGWAAASLMRGDTSHTVSVEGRAPAPYRAGLLALREAPLLSSAVEALPDPPDVLVVDATGRDHPRRAGMALHLGAALGLPSVGATHRTLIAHGEHPADERFGRSPILLDGEPVGTWLRTRAGTRPIAVHAAWRTDPDTAVAVVLATVRGVRTPEPLRLARQAARLARARAA